MDAFLIIALVSAGISGLCIGETLGRELENRRKKSEIDVFKKVNISPGDTVILRYPGTMTRETQEANFDIFKRHYPEYRIFILDRGIRLEGILHNQSAATKKSSDSGSDDSDSSRVTENPLPVLRYFISQK